MEEIEEIKYAEKRLFKAIEKLHPFIPVEVPEYLELYLSMHELRDKINNLKSYK